MPKPRSKPRPTRQKVKPGLKGFADAKKPKIDLLKDIQSHVVAEGAKNANVGREPFKIHVSELVKDTMCPRHLTFKISGEAATDMTPPAYHRLEMIWAAGHQEHAKWQRWLQEMGDLWGSWRCLECEHQWEAVSPPACPQCDSALLEYREVELNVDDLLVGHADGAVPRLECLVEIKSFSVGSVRYDSPRLVAEHTHKVNGKSLVDHEGLWNAVKRPLKSHLKQGLMYLWMCKQMGLPYEKIVFIYENKTTQATKTFEITLSERFIREHLDVLTEVTEHAKAGTLPPRPTLFDKDSKPCNACVYRTKCYGETSASTEESTPVPAGGQGSGSEAEGRESAVRAPGPSARVDSGDPGGHHRTGRPRTDRSDEPVDKVGRASRRAVGNGRGRRAVGRSGDGEVEGPRFARRKR